MKILIITNCPKGGPALVVTSRINKQLQNPMWMRTKHTHTVSDDGAPGGREVLAQVKVLPFSFKCEVAFIKGLIG